MTYTTCVYCLHQTKQATYSTKVMMLKLFFKCWYWKGFLLKVCKKKSWTNPLEKNIIRNVLKDC